LQIPLELAGHEYIWSEVPAVQIYAWLEILAGLQEAITLTVAAALGNDEQGGETASNKGTKSLILALPDLEHKAERDLKFLSKRCDAGHRYDWVTESTAMLRH